MKKSKNLEYLNKAKKYNPNNGIHLQFKKDDAEPLENISEHKLLCDTTESKLAEIDKKSNKLVDGVKTVFKDGTQGLFKSKKMDEYTDSDNKADCSTEKKERIYTKNPKKELCDKIECFSNLLDPTAEYYDTGIINDERKNPESLVDSWEYALGNGRCPDLSDVFKEIKDGVKIIQEDNNISTEKRILKRWYCYLGYIGLERRYVLYDSICLKGEMRYDFENSSQFKENTICIVKRTPWYCDNTILVEGSLEAVIEEITSEEKSTEDIQ